MTGQSREIVQKKTLVLNVEHPDIRLNRRAQDLDIFNFVHFLLQENQKSDTTASDHLPVGSVSSLNAKVDI